MQTTKRRSAQTRREAVAQFAVDRQIEERKLALPISQFKPNANGPNFAKLERRLLSNQLALVPGRETTRIEGGYQHFELLHFEGEFEA